MKRTTHLLVWILGLLVDPSWSLYSNVIKKTTYDYVIIGSGSAGSVLVNRLSETRGVSVLLLEVGIRPNKVVDIPILAPILQFTDYAWNYTMEKTPGVCLGLKDQKCRWPRGRGLGGSTLINYMIYTRGHRLDFDRWEADGNPGWSYKDVLPYFQKSEDSHLRVYEPNYHGHGGPLNVEDTRFQSKAAPMFLEAAAELGQSIVDYNGINQEGFSFVQSNTKRGVRHSGYKAFIQPVEMRSNLDILTESRATKILIDETTKTAYGVEFVKDKKLNYVNFTREVILAAGAFNSPQLLMLSGIGPRQQLKSIDVPVIHNLPGVGQNLQDHIAFAGLLYIVQGNLGFIKPDIRTNPSYYFDWLTTGQGPLSSIGGVEALGYLRTNASRNDKQNKYLDLPDIELVLMTGSGDKPAGELLRDTFGISDLVYDKIWSKLINKQICIILPLHLKPKSIGHLELTSKNPYHWPKFYGNHLSDKDNYDVWAFISAIRFVQKLMATAAFERAQPKLVTTPIPGCENYSYDSDQYWECAVRHVSTTLHHQVGTCKMGPSSDPTAVVDHELRVHGIKHLRVADTSVIPFALNAHTNAPSYMVGEKASDMIKQAWGDI